MKYKVGKRICRFEDPTRRHWSSNESRPLLTEIWYPTTDDAETTLFSFGAPEPLFQFDPVAINSPIHPEQSQYPLVVLSHGTGGSALQMGWFARQLAGQGYVCAAVNHHGNNSLEPYLAHGFALWWERARDLSCVIDMVLNDEAEFKDRIDERRVGVARQRSSTGNQWPPICRTDQRC